MNFKTTLALLVLVAAGGALMFLGLNPSALLERGPGGPAVPDGGTRAALEKLRAADLTRIELRRGDRVTVLTREHGAWNMPGKWPTRTAEADALAEQLGGLRSRFEPIAVRDDTDLAKYGLQEPRLTVKLETDVAKYAFVLGEGLGGEDRFARPTYLRLLSGPGVERPAAEVVRLGPGLLALLDRPADYYQQHKLFPGKRVPAEDDRGRKVDRLDATSVAVEEGKEGGTRFALRRDGEAWELSQPVRDRLEPRARDALLAAVPDVWAERFLNVDPDAVPAAVFPGDGLPAALTGLAWLSTTTASASPKWLLAKSGLDRPERTLSVTRDNGDTVTLLVGKASGARTRKVTREPPPGVPLPPREETVTEEMRYAKLRDNDQIFEIKDGTLKDVFVTLETLRDPRLARFETSEARELQIVQPGRPPVVLQKENDRWKLAQPLRAEADGDKVTELLGTLSGLRASGPDLLDREEPAHGFGEPGVALTVKWEHETKGPDGAKTKTPHALTLRLGRHDADAKKLYVKAGDWPRVNVVDDKLVSLAGRPALAYRGRRLFDFAARDLAAIEVRRGKQAATLRQAPDGWELVAPAAAKADGFTARQLADALGRLEVLEYVEDEPKAEKLAQEYGLGESAQLAVTLTFADPAKPARTLEVGKPRDKKPGYFAKLDDGASVFAVGADVHGLLDRDALAYLPQELWRVAPQDVTQVRIKRAGRDEFRLVPKDGGWRVAGPFDAPAAVFLVQALLQELAAPRCASYKALAAKDLTPFGLDEPALTLTVGAKGGKEYTLLVGGPVEPEGGGRFAKLADRPAIFVLPEQVAAAANRSALDLLDPVLLRLDPAGVGRVAVKNGDKSLTLERKGDGWQARDTPAGDFAADVEAAQALGSLWANLRAGRFADYGDKIDPAKYGLDKPAAAVTVAAKQPGATPETHMLELGNFVEGDGGPRFARLDKGPGVAVLSERDARTLARTYLDYVSRDVLKFKADDVAQVRRKTGAEELEIARQDDGWQIDKPAKQRGDDKTMQGLAAQLGDLRASRIAAFPAEELKEFGLDEPAAVWTIKLRGDAKPAELVLKLGKSADEATGARFAQAEGSRAVVVLPGHVARVLTAAPVAFRDHTLARFADADKIRLERGPRKAAFARVEGSWKLTEPLTADADNDELDDFLNTVTRLRADELVAEKPDAEALKRYGLDKPEARWRFLSGDREELHLLIGAREKDGPRCYARLAGRDVVFLLDPRLSGRCLGEFRTRAVWPGPFDAVQVEALRYGYAKNPFKLERGEDGWHVADKEVKLNTATVNETLAALASLKVARYVVDKDADLKLFGLEPPELVLEATTRAGGKRTLHLGRTEGDSRRLYARAPDPKRSDVFVLDEADSARILRDVAAFTKPPAAPAPPPPVP